MDTRELLKQSDELAEWGVALLTAWADRGAARQYSDEWKNANDRFWHALKNPPAAVHERLESERVYFLGVGK